jgi:hypothetical protein
LQKSSAERGRVVDGARTPGLMFAEATIGAPATMNSTQPTKRRARMSEINPPPIPHSWPADDWLGGTFTNSTEAARYLLRTHRAELTA